MLFQHFQMLLLFNELDHPQDTLILSSSPFLWKPGLSSSKNSSGIVADPFSNIFILTNSNLLTPHQRFEFEPQAIFIALMLLQESLKGLVTVSLAKKVISEIPGNHGKIGGLYMAPHFLVGLWSDSIGLSIFRMKIFLV
ncbi:hypothetical protein CVT25_002175 [Psilocybe cyanescens]|uniref:Uncharacterized protein n=1 Tax=Psilocybe cyanescens TaxID=93625 RepID=A0A409XUM8_PSICY|nr:hypothetical protein CVT25_002175 [Psilocybe cyanescens]